MKRRYVIVSSVTLFALVVLAVSWWGVRARKRADVLYVAVVGPMSGDEASGGQDMVDGIRLYLDQINQDGGVGGKTVKLLVYDDQSDSDMARAKAQEIAEKNQVLAVIGHFYSSTSAQAGEVYKAFGIPAITGCATAELVTDENDWYFRVIFTNRSQAAFLASYARRILGHRSAGIIYDQDSYGVSLADAFEETFRGLGGEVVYKHDLVSYGDDLESTVAGIADDLAALRADPPGIVFLATQERGAVETIVALRRKGLSWPLMGADAIGDYRFAGRFDEYPEEQARPGYFTDGVYVTSPLIFDVAGSEAQRFRNAFIARYGHEPTWNAATQYDAAIVLMQAIEAVEAQAGDLDLAARRELIRDYLAGLDSIEKAVDGVTGPLYFDEYGDVVGAAPIGMFSHQQLISAWVQLEPIVDIDHVADLDAELEAGRIIPDRTGGMYRTMVVYTGVDVNEISSLNTKDSSYIIDFYLWFRYRGQFEDDRIEFINAVNPVKLGEPIDEAVSDDGVTYRVYRVKAKFRGDFTFPEYPFDQQELAVRFRHLDLTRENLIYVQDVVGMRQTTNEALLAKFERAQVLKSIEGWSIQQASFFQDIVHNESTLGNPQFFDTDSKIEFSAFNTVIRIKRDGVRFSVKNLLPLFIITAVSYLVFFVPPRMLAVTNGLLRSALLAVAFFHLRLANDLPGIGYTVALDYTFYGFYILIVFALVYTLAIHRADASGHAEKAARLARIGQIIYPIIVLLGGLVFALRYEIITLPMYHQAGVDGLAAITVTPAGEAPDVVVWRAAVADAVHRDSMASAEVVGAEKEGGAVLQRWRETGLVGGEP